jgi:hypothetical protein
MSLCDWSSDVCSSDLDVSEKTLVEVKNICNAKLNDEVAINSTHDIARYWNAFRKDRLPAQAAYEIVKSSDKLPVI